MNNNHHQITNEEDINRLDLPEAEERELLNELLENGYIDMRTVTREGKRKHARAIRWRLSDYYRREWLTSRIVFDAEKFNCWRIFYTTDTFREQFSDAMSRTEEYFTEQNDRRRRDRERMAFNRPERAYHQ